MARRIICIRPEPGLSETRARGRELGLSIEGVSLFEIEPVVWEAPDPRSFDALLLGSANAIRHGGPRLAGLLDLPVYAVGKATAELAESAGFVVAQSGSGGLQALLDGLPAEPRRLLRLCGEDHVSLSCGKAREITEIVVYRSKPVEVPVSLAGKLGDEGIVMLHSAAAAEHFSSESKRLGVERHKIHLAVLSHRIAEAAGTGWSGVSVSPQSNDADLLAMIENLCQ